jgi:phosphoribosylformimino-5-aminoimidazole carboxamide ribotide isomerase
LDLYPAIDLRHGRCVRLVQGDYSRQTVYGGDPLEVARELEADGAPWVHVVDLDGARTGRPENRDVVTAIVEAVSVPVQAGGGIRDEFSAEALLGAGVARVVMGTAAVEDPAMVRRLATRHPDGTLGGPDLGGLASLLAATALPVIASGGVGSLHDLRALAGLEARGRALEGVIVGKALHDGAFTVGEAMAACARSG